MVVSYEFLVLRKFPINSFERPTYQVLNVALELIVKTRKGVFTCHRHCQNREYICQLFLQHKHQLLGKAVGEAAGCHRLYLKLLIGHCIIESSDCVVVRTEKLQWLRH